ncbi:unnamed protein product [Didymodactylos carnosus]|uniref:Heat shock protein 70 n=1 Tax=Didymodactylos carnosus TaxID=1234261 RepID=A0A815IEZ1_9BILA|nr:unnamed protein product [Didymodactylos carnosus]CAF1367249.1 unnamed protein product [Didymodactylos carnosus]CAF3906544.1 unnamed protein product [Didymodactylos carnosus]CAF4250272.1 unnamed protein product [Didymodactylos carnosus]
MTGAIGIDFGTSYSRVGFFRNGKLEIFTNELGRFSTPSYVAFTDREIFVGDEAKNKIKMNLNNTVFNMKRLVGKKFDKINMLDFPFTLTNVNNKPKFQVTYKNEQKIFSVEELCSMIIVKMRQIAERHLGRKVIDAVISVPSYYNFIERQSIKDAGTIAGLNILRVINDTSASALSYGLEKVQGEQNILIFDLGGGNLSTSVLKIEDGLYEVLSMAGNLHLGGEDFTDRMVSYFVKKLQKKISRNITDDKRTVQLLRVACENAKQTLSSSNVATIEMDLLFNHNTPFDSTITREKFEELNADLFCSILEPVERALHDSKLDKASINEIVLVGGSTRIPKVQEILEKFFNGKKLNQSVNPNESTACGAAIQAAILTDDYSRSILNHLLLDVQVFTLGIEVTEGIMAPIIRRNRTTTAKQTQIFTISKNYQSVAIKRGLEIKIFEGEHPMTKDNCLLETIELMDGPHLNGATGLSQLSRSASNKDPQIEVTIDTDNNGTLNVQVLDKTTGQEYLVPVTNAKNCLSKNEIKQMKTDCEKYRKEADEKYDRLQAKNLLESYCFNLKTLITENTLLHKIEQTLQWLETTSEEDEKNEYSLKHGEIEKMLHLADDDRSKAYSQFLVFSGPSTTQNIE